MSTSKWIAVSTALVFVGYVFFSDSLIAIFNPDSNMTASVESQSNSFKSQDLVVGQGDEARVGSVITAHYTGKLTDGTVFDSSVQRGEPFSFTLGVGQVIRGWDEGLLGMRVGGKRILTISPEYAYGDRQVGPIPPGSTLIFEVELIEVGK